MGGKKRKRCGGVGGGGKRVPDATRNFLTATGGPALVALNAACCGTDGDATVLKLIVSPTSKEVGRSGSAKTAAVPGEPGTGGE